MRLSGLILLVILAATAVYYLMTNQSDQSNISDDQSEFIGDVSPGNTTISPIDLDESDEPSELQTSYGRPLSTVNFKTVTGVTSVGLDMYHLDSQQGYQIIFNDSNDSFAINISKKPILDTRDVAVSKLSEILAVPVQDLCFLNIYISTTVEFSAEYGGKNIGIRQCNS